MLDFGLRGTVIAVTGGASGIGRATALQAARHGAHVAILDASEEAAGKAADEVRALDVKALPLVLDVRDTQAVDAAVERIENELGSVAGLVASAGVSRPNLSDRMSDEEWSLVIDVNLSGLYKTARAFGRRMLSRNAGSIVLIASVDGFGGHAGRAHYSASKHGVAGLAKSLAIEWGRFGVRVNAVAPGVVDTPLLRANIPTDHIESVMIGRVPMGRMSTGDDQAKASLFLLSDAASYVTGAVLPVDGGLTAGFFTNWNGADLGSKALLERGLYGPPA